MSAGGRPPVRTSTNGSGPDLADGSKGDATVVERTKVDSPDAEVAGPVEAGPAGSAGAGQDNEIVATADDQADSAQPDGAQPGSESTAVEQQDDQAGALPAEVARSDHEPDGESVVVERPDEAPAVVEQSADQLGAQQTGDDASGTHPEPDAEPAGDDVADADTRPLPSEPDASSADETSGAPTASYHGEPAASAEPEWAPATAAEPTETPDRAGDKKPDPIDVANQFAASAPEPASLFVRPDKASASPAPERVVAELPTLAPVDEVTMPEMASMVPEPDLHLRPAFQQHQYDTVSPFRRDRTVGGATVPVPTSWPDSQPVAEPGTPTTEDMGAATSASPDAGSGVSTYSAHAHPVPVPPAASETITNRTATVTPLSPTPTRPLETPPGTRKTPRPVPGPVPSRPAQPRRRPRRARLRLSRVDPWSVTKIALLFSIAMAITTLITVSLLWGVLNLMGVFTDVGQTVSEVTGSNNGGGVDVETMLSLSRVLKFTTIIVVLQAIVLTCLSTLAAFLYNASSGLVGGVEITLSEAE